MAGTNYSDDKIAYNAGINNDITTQTAPNTIGPDIVGPGFTDLADMLEPYILRINNNALFFGVPAPSNALGADYDIYYQQTNPINIYRKLSGAWVLQGSLPINFTLPEGNLTVRTSISGFTVTATKGGWVIANTVYQKATQTQITVTAADLNLGRIDIVYADTSNNILYLTGIAQSVPVAPALPANTILIDQVIVPSQSSGNAPYLLFGGEDPSASGLNFADSTGLINGGILTINANPALFDVSAGTAFFVDFTNPLVPIKKTVAFGPTSGIIVPGLTTSPSSYIGVNGNGQIVQQVTPFTNTQRRSIAILGILIHTNLTNINAINIQGSIILAPADQLHDFMNAVGPLNLTGNKYSAASTNLTIQKTAGTIFKFGANSIDFTNPHVTSQIAGNPVTFRYRTRNGEVSGDTTNVIPVSYDNAGIITAVPSNQFTIQHITMFQSGLTRIQYGQNLYSTLADAQAAAFSEPFAVESNIAENGIFRAYLIVKGNATNLANTAEASFLEVPKFGGTSGNAGSALTAANIIAALGYTPVDGPASSTDNAIARYDGTTGNVIQDSAVIIDDNGDTLHNGTGAIKLNVGTTAQRPVSLVDGLFRKNNSLTDRTLEYYDLTSASWRIGLFASGVTSNAILNQIGTVQTASQWTNVVRIGGSTTANYAEFSQTGNTQLNLTGVNYSWSISGFSQISNSVTWQQGNSLIIASITGTANSNSNVLTFGARNASNVAVTSSIQLLGGDEQVLNINSPKTKFSTTASIVLPVGTTGQRPVSLQDGDFRKNNTIGSLEFYDLTAANWRTVWHSGNSNLTTIDWNARLLNTAQTPGNFHWSIKNTLTRWDHFFSGAETGSNLGFNYIIRRYDDAGVLIGNALTIQRNNGMVDVPNNLTIANNQVIHAGIGLKLPQRSVTATTTIILTDYNLACDATSGAITVNLPTAASASGYEFTVIKTDASVNAVTIDPNGSETINGSATVANTAQYMSKTFYSNGTTWFIKQ